MSKFNYYKRVVEGKTIELHIREHKEEYVIGKVYPETENTVFKTKELIPLEDVNEFLDEGLSTGIFETTPIPNQII